MLIDFETFRALLKQTGLLVFRNQAPPNTAYPYIVYTYAHDKNIRASNKLLLHIKTFQVSIYSIDTEAIIRKLTTILDVHQVSYLSFDGIQGDENDQTVMNYFTYIDVIDHE